MIIVLTGGGSGGHITPILAVAKELKQLQPGVKLVYIGQTGDKLVDIPMGHSSIDEVFTVRAGKFRRYHGEGWRQLLDFPTILKNIRDALYVIVGMGQAFRLLGKLKPGLVFTPGGFVGVPVGIAAHFWHVPLVTHDLDAVPGLANRINARWAVVHAVGMPKELYNYPPDKTAYVGVPVADDFKLITEASRLEYKRQIGVSPTEQVLFVTGGGLGADRINQVMVAVLPMLLSKHANLRVFHVVGAKHEAAIKTAYEQALTVDQRGRVVVAGFIPDLYRYSGAADLIVTRAGANTLAEFAIQGKACIIIPNPVLSGGHQLKNAQYLAEQGAVSIVTEDQLRQNPEVLSQSLTELLNNPAKRQGLEAALGRFAKPHATKDLAMLLLKVLSPSKNTDV